MAQSHRDMGGNVNPSPIRSLPLPFLLVILRRTGGSAVVVAVVVAVALAFLACHPRRGSASVVAFACSFTPTKNLSFRPEQFGLFANCAAEKPVSLPIPFLRRNLAFAFVVVVPSPGPKKPVKPEFHVSPTFQSTSPLPNNSPPPATIELDTKKRASAKAGALRI
jgi:hypothetical protein